MAVDVTVETVVAEVAEVAAHADMWEPVDDGHTRMVLRNTGRPTGFAARGARAMAAAMRSAMTKDLARVRERLGSR